jgi:hypothetical protein
MSYVSVTHCSFIRKGDASLSYSSLDQMGLFKVPMYDPDHRLLGCISYDSRSEWDRNFKMVRAMGVFLLFCLSVVTILYTLSVLFLVNEKRKFIIHWICRSLIFPALLFNTLLFILFGGEECDGEDTKCSPGPGAILAMVNEVVILAAAFLFILIPQPTNPYFVRNTLGDVESTGLPFRDGSIFSVPETVKARNTMQKKVNKSPSVKDARNRTKSRNAETKRARDVSRPNRNADDSSTVDGPLQTSSSTMDSVKDEESAQYTPQHRTPSRSTPY